MTREFHMPKHIVTGTHAMQDAGNYFRRMGTKALIVSDPVMVALHNVEKLCRVLDQQAISYTIYTEITGEPTDDMIMKGCEQFQKEACDFMIAMGGGSPIDAMKAIGVVSTGNRHINDYMGRDIHVPMPPMAAIPTTAGTGSEATQFTIITNTKENVKMLLKGACLLPELAIIDPQFTMSAPQQITASTGLDALCHAIESYTSKKAQTLSKSFSISAIKKIMAHLTNAYDDGTDMIAREQMAIAALEAGIAFNNASVTLIHGMSRPLGALYHVPHGVSNAMLLDICLRFAMKGQEGVFAELARECGFADVQMDDQMAANTFLQMIHELVEHCQIRTLETFQITKERFYADIPKMAQDAMESGSPQNTIRECNQADIEKIYKDLWVHQTA